MINAIFFSKYMEWYIIYIVSGNWSKVNLCVVVNSIISIIDMLIIFWSCDIERISLDIFRDYPTNWRSCSQDNSNSLAR